MKKLSAIILLVVVVSFLPGLLSCAKPTTTPTTPTAPTKPTAPAPTPAPAEKPFKPVKMSISIGTPLSSAIVTKLWIPWSKEIEQRTNGRVIFDIYPSSTLLPTENNYRGVAEDIADVGSALHSHTPGRFPLWEVTDLTFLIPSISTGNRVISDLWQKFPELRAEHDSVKLLSIVSSPISEIHTVKKAVRRIEDIKGMKLTGSKGNTVSAEQVGAIGVPQPPAEFYGSMEKGVVDGLVVPYGVIGSFKLMELLKYHTHVHFGANSQWFAMSKATWNSLPPDIQQVITEASAKMPDLWITATDAEAANALEEGKRLKHEFIELSPEERARWVAVAKPTWDKWVEERAAKGPAKAMLEEAIKLVDKYK